MIIDDHLKSFIGAFNEKLVNTSIKLLECKNIFTSAEMRAVHPYFFHQIQDIADECMPKDSPYKVLILPYFNMVTRNIQFQITKNDQIIFDSMYP